MINNFQYDEKTNHLSIARAGIIITHACTLRCKKCIEMVPYYEQPYNPKLKSLLEEIDRYFELVNHTERFDLTGGEPILRSDLPKILNHIYENYMNQFDGLRINTNGSVLPSTELFEICERFGGKFDFMISDYGANLSKSVLKLTEECDLRGLKYIRRDYSSDAPYMGGWIDYEFAETSCSTAEAQEHFQKCTCHDLLQIRDKHMEACGHLLQFIDFGIIRYQDVIEAGHLVELFNAEKTVQQIKCDVVKMLSQDYYLSCMYCEGRNVDRQRFNPAEQLPKNFKKE